MLNDEDWYATLVRISGKEYKNCPDLEIPLASILYPIWMCAFTLMTCGASKETVLNQEKVKSRCNSLMQLVYQYENQDCYYASGPYHLLQASLDSG